MKEWILIILPLASAVFATLWRNNQTRPWFLPIIGCLHVVLCFELMANRPFVNPETWIGFDALTASVLPAVSLLFLVCGCYAIPYLRIRKERSNRVFVASMLAVLGLMSAGHQAQNLGVLWIATEALTLAAVPLIHFNNTPRAFEATWKYLLVGGTGIALSLLGSFCLGYSSLHGGGKADLSFVALMAQGPELSRHWVLTAWVLLLVGYGTKMGLAPMHTWKADAYGEAAGLVGAILAGGVTSVAFTAILRIRSIVNAAGESQIADHTLLAIGLFSMAVAALFLLGTRDYKRMLAYSSVEHMGILSIAASLGALGVWAALFHLWSNMLTKGALFLSASNIRRASGSPTIDDVSGMAHVVPRSVALFIAGMFAITACPPFAPFFSELKVLGAALQTGHVWTAVGFLSCLLFAFFGLSRVVFSVVDGQPHAKAKVGGKQFQETWPLILPPLALLIFSLWVGLFTPSILQTTWDAAVLQLFPNR